MLPTAIQRFGLDQDQRGQQRRVPGIARHGDCAIGNLYRQGKGVGRQRNCGQLHVHMRGMDLCVGQAGIDLAGIKQVVPCGLRVAAHQQTSVQKQREGKPAILPALSPGDPQRMGGGGPALRNRVLPVRRARDRAVPDLGFGAARMGGRRALSSRVQLSQQIGQKCGHLAAPHAGSQLRPGVDPQDQHVEGGQRVVKVVIVQNAVGQAVEVVQRAYGLRQFFMQAIAHLLRSGIRGKEDCDPLALPKSRPVELPGATRRQIPGPVRHAGHDKAGYLWHRLGDLRMRHERDGDGRRTVDPAQVHPGLGPQATEEGVKVFRGKRRGRRDKPDRDGPLESRKDRQVAAAFKPERKIEEIARNFGIRACHACYGFRPLRDWLLRDRLVPVIRRAGRKGKADDPEQISHTAI